jgi:hypothetical protein
MSQREDGEGASFVAATKTEIEKKTGAIAHPTPSEPFHNPSYPVRDHFAERSKLEEALRSSEERVALARQKLETGRNHTGHVEAVRTYHQLLGVRDQIAECARRMPLETGGLYREDAERFNQASAALERVWSRWERMQR